VILNFYPLVLKSESREGSKCKGYKKRNSVIINLERANDLMKTQPGFPY
jgi:hypothetical protein